MSTIAHTLQALQHQGLDRAEARQLLLHTLGRPATDRAWLLSLIHI